MEITTCGYAIGNLCRMGKKPKPLWERRAAAQRRPIFVCEWREARGMTQEQLAERLGTTKATISRIENRKSPASVDFLEMASDILGCHHSDLIRRPPVAAERGPIPLRQIGPIPSQAARGTRK